MPLTAMAWLGFPDICGRVQPSLPGLAEQGDWQKKPSDGTADSAIASPLQAQE